MFNNCTIFEGNVLDNWERGFRKNWKQNKEEMFKDMFSGCENIQLPNGG